MAGRLPYRDDVLRALARHGIRPRPDTPPEVAYDLLKSIYAFEVRELNIRRREAERVLGPQPLAAYRAALHRLVERYPVLKIPSHHWVDRGGG